MECIQSVYNAKNQKKYMNLLITYITIFMLSKLKLFVALLKNSLKSMEFKINVNYRYQFEKCFMF